MKPAKLEQTSVEMSLQVFSKYSILDLTLTEYMFVNYMNLISIEYGLISEISNLYCTIWYHRLKIENYIIIPIKMIIRYNILHDY